MDQIIHPKIFEGLGLNRSEFTIGKFGSGLINHTFRLCAKNDDEKDLILQRINTQVFKNPEKIAENHQTAVDYLSEHAPNYFFLAPVTTAKGKALLEWNEEYWRILPFVDHAITIDEASNPKQAFEAAKQFGKFAKNLSGLDLGSLKPTITNFHNLTLRYNDFQSAIDSASVERKEEVEDLINAFQQHSEIAVTYEKLKTDPDFRDRMMHHDTKINNVMLDDKSYEGVCVIDLDTMMPGKIISDIGDMVRTYVSPVSEEETDFSKIIIREDYYEALMKGYLSEVGSELTETEKGVIFYAGQFMIYMQGLRFLTDYLNGDVYYGIKYPKHNFNRAKIQLVLLEALNEKEESLKRLISKYL